MKNGIELIAEERERQVNEEGWSAAHDDEHTTACLAVAGACYALEAGATGDVHESWQQAYHHEAKRLFPFDAEWWKPSDDPVRNLVKAGALIAAEIDRLQRAHKETTR